jgi:hypothetical protein
LRVECQIWSSKSFWEAKFDIFAISVDWNQNLADWLVNFCGARLRNNCLWRVLTFQYGRQSQRLGVLRP